MKQLTLIALVVVGMAAIVWVLARGAGGRGGAVVVGDGTVEVEVAPDRTEGSAIPDTAWRTEGDVRWRPLEIAGDPGAVGFARLPGTRTGITRANELSHEDLARNTLLINGSGVAAGDVNGDGLVDLYFCHLDGGGSLYRNLGGMRFRDVTAESGTACDGRVGSGAALADIDGDGDLDLLVTALLGSNACLRNDGHGRFTDVTETAGLGTTGACTSLALGDIDADGDLDLYVARYRENTYQDFDPPAKVYVQRVGGQAVVMPERWQARLSVLDGQIVEFGEPDLLYLGDGAGHFTLTTNAEQRFSDASGQPVSMPGDWGLTATFRDLNDDGRPDLYVCNDFWTPDRIWLNQGDGRFRAPLPGSFRTSSRFSMAVDMADIEDDGDVDVLVVDMLSRDYSRRQRQAGVVQGEPYRPGDWKSRPQVMRNTLYASRGDGTFAEIAQYAGVDASEWSWSVLFLDADLDGYQDVLVGNGNLHDAMDSDTGAIQHFQGANLSRAQLLEQYPDLLVENLAFRNRGDTTFAETGRAWGFHAIEVSSGIAAADLDGDGDQDVIVNHLRAPGGIYENLCAAPRIGVRLLGDPPNTSGIGARVTLREREGRTQHREIVAGGRYLSHCDTTCTFAAPPGAGGPFTLEVRWSDGTETTVPDVEENRLYEISAGDSVAPSPPREAPATLFEDVTPWLGFHHEERPFDDFARQPLLPRRLDQLGPGVAWHDLDGDGDEDLLVAGGRGQQMGVFTNEASEQRFAPWEGAFLGIAERDQGAVVVIDTAAATLPLVLVGSQSYEDGDAVLPAVLGAQVRPGGAMPGFDLPGSTASTGPLAAADYDGDGRLDLFVGGRVIPGRYPEAAGSRLYLGREGGFELDGAASAALDHLGLVTGAVWSDLEGDGDPDLVLAREWAPLIVLENDDGKLTDRSAALGLADTAGWWNGVVTGDFDGDSRPDLLATGWGLNHRRRRDLGAPLLLYHGDLDGKGAYDVIEAHYEAALDKTVPDRALKDIMAGLPDVTQRIKWYRDYAEQSVDEIFGPWIERARVESAQHLAHTVFLRRDDGFVGLPLPAEAQLAPAFGAAVADFDGDGREDVVLAQGFFGVEPLDSRLDAGRGLLLLGRADGSFEPAPRAGMASYGEGRGLAVADFDGDGRADLAYAESAGPTRLYRNAGGRPGLRVRVRGSHTNPAGIGTALQLVGADGTVGPLREVQAGSGYWSCSSPVLVLHLPEGVAPTKLRVRWGGGAAMQDLELPPAALEVAVDAGGHVERFR